jgi:ABC-type glutathione transport system ATPase component
MIAMALIKEPEILIADEPTTALDVTVQLQILQLIKHIQRERGLSVIFISHDLAVVADLADHVLVMEKGNVVESGPARQVLESPSHSYTQKLIAAIPKTAKSDTHKWLADSDQAFLVVKSLNKTFNKKVNWPWQKKQKGVQAINDVSLTIGTGEIVGLVGESGSGKSTLGRCIIRLRRPDSGEVLFHGVDYLKLTPAELQEKRRDFQMIFQDPYASLNPRMTIFDALVEPLKCHKLVPPSQYLEEVNRLMDDVGLARGLIRKYPHEFSGGQRQRIAIARALAMKPKFIVADEPVSALDVTIQAQILELLLALTKKYKLTMLFISHDLAVVRYISDRVLVMKQGKIIEQGQTEEIFHSPKQEYTKALLSSIRAL